MVALASRARRANRRVATGPIPAQSAPDMPDHLRAQGRHFRPQPSPSAINSNLGAVKGFYGWLKARKLITDSPFETIRRLREVRTLPRILTIQEVLRLIHATAGATSRRDKAMLEILYSSGCRAA